MRIGVVGMGIIWETVHMPFLSEMADTFEITAYCTRTEESLNRWRGKYPDATAYTDYRELLNDKSVDAVLVATPINLNSAVALDALNMGKHVFVEKPIALSYKSGTEILEAEARSGKIVYLFEQAAYHPQIPVIEKLISSGDIGRLVSYEKVSNYQIEKAGAFAQTEWRKNADFPLGLIFDAGFHDMALLKCVFGLPHTVYSGGAKFRPDMGEYDHIMSMFSYDNDVFGLFSYSTLNYGDNSFIIRGTEGTLYIEDERLFVVSKTEERKEIKTFESDLYPEIYNTMWESLAESARKEEPPLFPASAAVEMLRIYDAIGKSIKSGLPEKT